MQDRPKTKMGTNQARQPAPRREAPKRQSQSLRRQRQFQRRVEALVGMLDVSMWQAPDGVWKVGFGQGVALKFAAELAQGQDGLLIRERLVECRMSSTRGPVDRLCGSGKRVLWKELS